MIEEIYQFIETNEDTHWWFRARKNIIRMFLLQQQDYFDTVLDIGCGSGSFLHSIEDISGRQHGIDEYSYKNANRTVVQGDALNIPFDRDSMDLVTMLDVLEHIPESDRALGEMRRVMKEGGIGVITVPAMQALYSPHDANNHHVKRYGKKDLLAQLEQNGFQVLRCSYFNTWLFPIEAIIRLAEKMLKREFQTQSVRGNQTNELLFKIFNSEQGVLKNHELPYGLSLIAVVKPVNKEPFSFHLPNESERSRIS